MAQRPDETAETGEVVGVSADRLRELEYRELMEQARGDLNDWGKRRFWGVVVIGAVAGAVGLSALSVATLQGLIGPEIKDAVKATDRAVQAAERANAATDEATAKAAELTKSITVLREAASAIEERQGVIQQQIAEADKNLAKILGLEVDTEGLQKQIDAMAARLATLESDDGPEPQPFSTVQMAIQTNVAERKQVISDNASYRVFVNVAQAVLQRSRGGFPIPDTIRSKGYSVQVEPVYTLPVEPLPPFDGSVQYTTDRENLIVVSPSAQAKAREVQATLRTAFGIDARIVTATIRNIDQKFAGGLVGENVIYVLLPQV